MRQIFLLAAFLLFLTGCSKDIEEYNKPAAYWYKRMIESVSDGNLDKADNYYSSLQSEHIGSPLLPEATMIMAQSHFYLNSSMGLLTSVVIALALFIDLTLLPALLMKFSHYKQENNA